MTTFIEPTGGAWIRDVNRRLAILERLPRSTAAATISGSDLSGDTSVAFDASTLETSGTYADPTRESTTFEADAAEGGTEPLRTLGEVRRNLSLSPRATGGGYAANNANWTMATNISIAGEGLPQHPDGVATTARSTVATVSGIAVASLNNMDALGASAVVRGIGVWVYCAVEVNAVVFMLDDQAGTTKTTNCPAGQWTFCTSGTPGTGSARMFLNRASGSPSVGDKAYITGSIAESDTIPSSFFDGSTRDTTEIDYDWTGAVGTSESIASTISYTDVLADDPYLQENYDLIVPTGSATDLNYSPVTPSDPMVESRTGAVAVTWDGLGSGGESMPVNLYRVEIHRSVEGAAFEPDSTTYAASMYIAGTHVFTDQEYDVQWWYKLVTLDQTGLRSTYSTAIPGMAQRVIAGDIAANAVTANTIAADALDARIITGSVIRTAASGTRFELGKVGATEKQAITLYSGTSGTQVPGGLYMDDNTGLGPVSMNLVGWSASAAASVNRGSVFLSEDGVKISGESLSMLANAGALSMNIGITGSASISFDGSDNEMLLFGDSVGIPTGNLYMQQGDINLGEFGSTGTSVLYMRRLNAGDSIDYESRYYLYSGADGGQSFVTFQNGTEAARMELITATTAFRVRQGTNPFHYMPRVYSGSFSRAVLNAGTGATQAITFPANFFTANPIVFATCDASRINFGTDVTGLTTANVRMDNFTAAATAATTVYWVAIQRMG